MDTERRPATPAEARALSHPLRLRILRLCLDASLSNRALADRLGQDPATVLHHVRTLVRTGFLAADVERRGRRGAREIPYRSTGKSWTLDVGSAGDDGMIAIHDAVRAELLDAGPDALLTGVRLAVRLDEARLEELGRRLKELVADAHAWDTEGGAPIALYLVAHRRT
jgi:DNA-binding transcriptional ArsR family regulator